MLNIDNKFEIGQEVYVIRKERTKEKCPACNGDGTFLHKGYKVKCTYCYGSGNVFTHDKMWQVDKEPMTVDSMKISIGADKNKPLLIP